MRFHTRLGALLAAVTAIVLALASPALAKQGRGGGGGGGGGDTTCASITAFDNTAAQVLDGDVITSTLGVTNSCVDEVMAAVSFDYRNDLTGTIEARNVIMASYGPFTYTSRFGTSNFSVPYTVIATVTRPNGQVVATRSQSLTMPAAPAPTPVG